MEKLFIYHQNTGVMIPLSDEVYLISERIAGEQMARNMSDGCGMYPMEHLGYRLDNYNMTNLFFGGAE